LSRQRLLSGQAKLNLWDSTVPRVPVVTFTAVNISDAVAVDNPDNADSAVIVL